MIRYFDHLSCRLFEHTLHTNRQDCVCTHEINTLLPNTFSSEARASGTRTRVYVCAGFWAASAPQTCVTHTHTHRPSCVCAHIRRRLLNLCASAVRTRICIIHTCVCVAQNDDVFIQRARRKCMRVDFFVCICTRSFRWLILFALFGARAISWCARIACRATHIIIARRRTTESQSLCGGDRERGSHTHTQSRALCAWSVDVGTGMQNEMMIDTLRRIYLQQSIVNIAHLVFI